MSSSISTALIAAVLGVVLAGAAAFGVVKSQESAGSSTNDQSQISYDG